MIVKAIAKRCGMASGSGDVLCRARRMVDLGEKAVERLAREGEESVTMMASRAMAEAIRHLNVMD